MGAIAVSQEEERRIALAALERRTEEERLRRHIAESVRRCASADRRENLELAAAGVAPRAPRS